MPSARRTIVQSVMQFFTSEWWGRGDMEACTAYRQRFESIRHELPRDLVRLHERYALHDGHLRSIALSDRTRNAHYRSTAQAPAPRDAAFAPAGRERLPLSLDHVFVIPPFIPL